MYVMAFHHSKNWHNISLFAKNTRLSQILDIASYIIHTQYMNKDIRKEQEMAFQTIALRKFNYQKATHAHRCGNCLYGLPCIKLGLIQNEIKKVLESVSFRKCA